ncbi:MAG: periplasmic heavy metal sensor [Roseobacter sp.]
MQKDDQKPVKKPTAVWVKALLAASLVANFAFAGLMAGAAIRHQGKGDSGSRGPGAGAFGAPYMLALSGEDRRRVREFMRASSTQGLPNREMRREMFQDVVASLRSAPFDVNELQQVLKRQTQASVSVQSQAQLAWIEVITGMDDSERAAYADAVEDILKRGPKRR